MTPFQQRPFFASHGWSLYTGWTASNANKNWHQKKDFCNRVMLIYTLSYYYYFFREDQSVWERRAPLAPSHVRKLVRKGIKVIVQPSNRRAYPMQAYASAGAIIQEDLSDCSVIFGVKQVPIDSLMSNKTFCFFSHTIKVTFMEAKMRKNVLKYSSCRNSNIVI
jgi:hypothetical protein